MRRFIGEVLAHDKVTTCIPYVARICDLGCSRPLWGKVSLTMIKITKFGGSSVADAEHFRKIKAIIDADPARRFVVVSACGRRTKSDTKVTDLLYLVDAHVNYHVSCDDLLADIVMKSNFSRSIPSGS